MPRHISDHELRLASFRAPGSVSAMCFSLEEREGKVCSDRVTTELQSHYR